VVHHIFPPYQIVSHSGLFSYIVFVTYLDINRYVEKVRLTI